MPPTSPQGGCATPYTNALWNALPQNGFTPIPGAQPWPGEEGTAPLCAPVPAPDRGLRRGDPGAERERRLCPLPVPGRRGEAMSLEGRNLTFGYRKKGRVLDQISLTLEPGERLGLAGPSGRGKTTLCKLLAGYERPGGGEVLLDGRPLDTYRGLCRCR